MNFVSQEYNSIPVPKIQWNLGNYTFFFPFGMLQSATFGSIVLLSDPTIFATGTNKVAAKGGLCCFPFAVPGECPR
jgi:hypothetical protein